MTFVPPEASPSGHTLTTLADCREPLDLVRGLDAALTQIDFPANDGLRKGFGALRHIYRPQAYAEAPLAAWLEQYGRPGPRRALFLGMNPGPWGMGQTGIPFGDPEIVRSWMGLTGPVHNPKGARPDRPVLGLHSKRRESSGQSLYGWAMERFGTAESFFRWVFVVNYCPLLFFDENGKNVIPTDFRKGGLGLREMTAWCDAALQAWIAMMEPTWVVGIGGYATARLTAALEALPAAGKRHPKLASIIHPSPQTRGHWGRTGWSAYVEKQMADSGLIWD
ncbi:MAG: single-stranded DNA-binding protein [Candidatus Sericytochromatia bacterium]|nr:single-stranded DNA-binding protein [Candidatus Sericytochromatia bacterium]